MEDGLFASLAVMDEMVAGVESVELKLGTVRKELLILLALLQQMAGQFPRQHAASQQL